MSDRVFWWGYLSSRLFVGMLSRALSSSPGSMSSCSPDTFRIPNLNFREERGVLTIVALCCYALITFQLSHEICSTRLVSMSSKGAAIILLRNSLALCLRLALGRLGASTARRYEVVIW